MNGLDLKQKLRLGYPFFIEILLDLNDGATVLKRTNIWFQKQRPCSEILISIFSFSFFYGTLLVIMITVNTGVRVHG